MNEGEILIGSNWFDDHLVKN